MKIKKLLLLLIVYLVGCNSQVESNSVRSGSISTGVYSPQSQSLSRSTQTAVPDGNDFSCDLVRNPNPTPDGLADENRYIPNAENYRICTFSGQISRGETYKRKITQYLVFCLVPGGVLTEVANEGWDIVISDALPGSCDVESEDFVNFGPVVTPPFYGNLLFYVYGWHFRNADNSGENDGSVVAPPKERTLYFVLNRKDYERAFYALGCHQWGTDADCALATQYSTDDEIPTSQAIFTVTQLELGNLVPGSHAWIEQLEFRVDIILPAE